MKGKALIFIGKNSVVEFTGLLLITDQSGKTYKGYAQQYLTDINDLHITRKKGDIEFFTENDEIVNNISTFKNL